MKWALHLTSKELTRSKKEKRNRKGAIGIHHEPPLAKNQNEYIKETTTPEGIKTEPEMHSSWQWMERQSWSTPPKSGIR